MSATVNIQATISEAPPLHVCCKKCGGKAGQIVDGVLIYTVKHSGEHHTIRIDLKFLQKLLHASAEK
jgi:hypothetical protein